MPWRGKKRGRDSTHWAVERGSRDDNDDAADRDRRHADAREQVATTRVLLANLANVEAVSSERFNQFVLFVREMRQQRVGENVRRPAELGEVARVGDEIDQRAVEALQDVMDDGVLFAQSVDDRFELRLAGPQMGEHFDVLETMMQRDHSVVGGAVDADGPIVLSNRELIE